MIEPSGSTGPSCPKCEGIKSNIVDSRTQDGMKRRRRLCNACNFRYTTYESSAPKVKVGTRRIQDLIANLDSMADQLDGLRSVLTELLLEESPPCDAPAATTAHPATNSSSVSTSKAAWSFGLRPSTRS